MDKIKAIDRLFMEADRLYKDGVNILILTDRGVDENHVAIPSLLAASAMSQHLVKTKKKTSATLILDSAERRIIHGRNDRRYLKWITVRRRLLLYLAEIPVFIRLP